jgi:hypothetical protein
MTNSPIDAARLLRELRLVQQNPWLLDYALPDNLVRNVAGDAHTLSQVMTPRSPGCKPDAPAQAEPVRGNGWQDPGPLRSPILNWPNKGK